MALILKYFTWTRGPNYVFICKWAKREKWLPLHLSPCLPQVSNTSSADCCRRLVELLPLTQMGQKELSWNTFVLASWFYRSLPAYVEAFIGDFVVTLTSSLFRCSWLSSVLARLSWLWRSRALDWDDLSLAKTLCMLSSTCRPNVKNKHMSTEILQGKTDDLVSLTLSLVSVYKHLNQSFSFYPSLTQWSAVSVDVDTAHIEEV